MMPPGWFFLRDYTFDSPDEKKPARGPAFFAENRVQW